MINRLVRLLTCLLLLAGLAFGVYAGQWLMAQWELAKGGGAAHLTTQVRKTTVYTLVGKEWMVFASPPAGTTARLVTHADLQAVAARAGATGGYALEIEVTDARGRVLLSRLVEYEAPVRFYYRPPAGQPQLTRFYRERDDIPAETRESLVHIPNGVPWSVRVRLVASTPAVRAVQLRLYGREPVNPARLDYLWERLTRSEREQLAEGLLYPESMLTTNERRNLVRNRWRPNGPRGVEGKDFIAQNMYVLADPLLAPVPQQRPPFGRHADSRVRASFRVPGPGGRLHLQMNPVDHSGMPGTGEQASAWMRFWPQDQDTPQVQGPYSGRWEVALETAGLVEILVNRDVRLAGHLVAADSGERVELELQPAALRTWAADQPAGLNYPVRHAGAAPTLFRLDLRTVYPAGALLDPGARALELSLLDAEGRVRERHALQHLPVHSLYDYQPGESLMHVGSADRRYLRVPPGITSLRVAGPPDIRVAAYNRPGALVRQVTPDAGTDDTDDDVRDWFPLRPQTDASAGADAEGELLLLGAQPPRRSSLFALQGQYLWEDFPPRENSLSRQLLEPRTADTRRRPQLLSSFFVPLQNGEQSLYFAAPEARAAARPELLYVNAGTRVRNARVQIDGRTVFRGRLPAGSGTVSLGALPVGTHRVAVNAPGLQLYLNHVHAGQAGLLRRAVVQLDRNSLRFDVTKRSQGVETLSLRFYRNSALRADEEVTVRLDDAELQAGGPFTGITLPVSRVILRPSASPALRLLSARGPGVQGYEPVFMKLGEDLPPGRHTLRIDWPGGVGGQVLVSRLSPGEFTSAQVYRLGADEWQGWESANE